MAESKYGKYIVRGTAEKVSTDEPGVRTRTMENDWGSILPKLNWKYVSNPAQIVDTPHAHDFDEFWVFTGSDPTVPDEFAAEVEICMGKEKEKSIIRTPAVVVLPKGMVHGPINFTKVDKPVIFCNIYLSADYRRK